MEEIVEVKKQRDSIALCTETPDKFLKKNSK